MSAATDDLVGRLGDLRLRVSALCDSETRPLALHWSDAVTIKDAMTEIEALKQRITNIEQSLVLAMGQIRT